MQRPSLTQLILDLFSMTRRQRERLVAADVAEEYGLPIEWVRHWIVQSHNF